MNLVEKGGLYKHKQNERKKILIPETVSKFHTHVCFLLDVILAEYKKRKICSTLSKHVLDYFRERKIKPLFESKCVRSVFNTVVESFNVRH